MNGAKIEEDPAVKLVKVKDVALPRLAPPFCLNLARAVSGPFLPNGARYLGLHLAPADLGEFYLTAIVDESTPAESDRLGKLMVQGGAQYGCQAANCSFCVYWNLPFYRNLSVTETVDLFRLALFMYARNRPLPGDQRTLVIKFSDNGEPLQNPALPEILDQLVAVFGQGGKILSVKISTILMDNALTGQVFQKIIEWQARNFGRASVHLQISRSQGRRRLASPELVAEMVETWVETNPRDTVCIAPGLAQGCNRRIFADFYQALKGVKDDCFFRLSVIKPTCARQRRLVLTREELNEINRELAEAGFKTDPLPQDSSYRHALCGAGTLSHLPDGRVFDPENYQAWNWEENKTDPNI